MLQQAGVNPDRVRTAPPKPPSARPAKRTKKGD
jgi:hypothetical protein